MVATSLVLAVLATSGQASGPIAACPGAPRVTLTSELTPPVPGMTQVVLGTLLGHTSLSSVALADGKATLGAPTLAAWQAFAAATPNPVLLWSRADASRCSQELQVGEAPAPRGAASEPALGGVVRDATGDCAVDATSWNAELEAADPGRARTVIVFGGANPCYRSDTRRPAAHGDPIYVAVLTQNATEWANAAVAFTPCDIESAVPQVQASGEFPASLRQSARWLLLTALPRSCWNDAVTISIKAANAQAGHVLPQYARYRATVHLGTIFTNQHKVAFGLLPQEEEKFIVNKGPVDDGPEYVASVVFYSVLRYIPPLFNGRSFKGREIRNEQGFIDRLGFSIGVGLKDPTERFVYGATFELFSGVNLFGGWDRALLNVLPEGLEENTAFAGEEKDLQIAREWTTTKVVGLTFDLAYVAKIFK